MNAYARDGRSTSYTDLARPPLVLTKVGLSFKKIINQQNMSKIDSPTYKYIACLNIIIEVIVKMLKYFLSLDNKRRKIKIV